MRFAFKCKLCGYIVYSNTTRKSSMWRNKCGKNSLIRSKKDDSSD